MAYPSDPVCTANLAQDHTVRASAEPAFPVLADLRNTAGLTCSVDARALNSITGYIAALVTRADEARAAEARTVDTAINPDLPFIQHAIDCEGILRGVLVTTDAHPMEIATMFAKRADTGEIVAVHVMIPAHYEVRDEENFDGNDFESETMGDNQDKPNTIDEIDIDVVGQPITFAEDDGSTGVYKGDYITQLWNQLQTRISD